MFNENRVSTRQGLKFSFVIGCLPWLMSSWLSAGISILLGETRDFSVIFALSFIAILGGITNALYTRHVGNEDRDVQLGGLFFYFLGALTAPFIVRLISPNTMATLAQGPSMLFIAIVAIFLSNSYLVIIRMLDRKRSNLKYE